MSAIKSILVDDGYCWDESKLVARTLMKACKIVNDCVRTRLPIKTKLLEILLFEVKRYYHAQVYLSILYQTLFCTAYYGLFRIGEVTTGTHPVRAKDVYIGTNKDKILFILYTSKTHRYESRPQKIKIKANNHINRNSFFCPFKLARQYFSMRGEFVHENDPFFVFRDHTPVKPMHANSVLRKMIKRINLDYSVYSFHSLRIGRSTEMMEQGCTIQQIQIAGRWKSNAVFRYLRS